VHPFLIVHGALYHHGLTPGFEFMG
jgi:hypothetical protein